MSLFLVIILCFVQTANGLSYPTQSNETPTDGSQLSSDLTQLCIDLNDSDGDNMYWEIRQGGNVLENGTPFSYPTHTYNFSGCGCRCNRSLNYSRSITINHSFIDSDLTNFPVLVNLSNDIVSKANGGDSLRFYDVDCNLLAHEIDYWDNSSYSFVWVNITSISSTVDTTFYIYYNNSNAVSAENPTGVWDSNFVMVQHMNDATTSTILDSTINDNDGTKKGANEPIASTGVIGNAQDFDGSDDYVDCGNDGSILLGENAKPLTVSCWLNIDVSHNWANVIYPFLIVSRYGFKVLTAEKGQLAVWGVDAAGNTLVTNNSWHHFSGSWNGTDSVFYLDSNNDGTGGGVSVAGGTNNLFIGKRNGVGNSEFYGLLDEVHISNVVRSHAWINASYNNQNQTTGFLIVDSEVPNNCSHEARWECSPTSLRMTAETTFDCTEYENISYVDSLNVTTNCPSYDWSHHHFLFNISENPYNVTNIDVNWHGYAGSYFGGAKPKWYWEATMYIKKGTWASVANTTLYTGSPHLEWLNWSTTHPGYINPSTGVLDIAIENTYAGRPSIIYTDYVEVVITYITGGDPNGTYCTNNVSFWPNTTCEEWWTWSVFVDDGHHNSYTTDYTFQNMPCVLSGYLYPIDNATNICPCCDAMCVGIGELYDWVNLSFYRRGESDDDFYMVEEYVHITNGTYCFCIDGHINNSMYWPMRYNSTYYWYVYVENCDNSSLNITGSTYSFTTAISPDNCPCGESELGNKFIILRREFLLPVFFMLTLSMLALLAYHKKRKG